MGRSALDPPAAWEAMQRRVRNLGRSGLAATAISAVDAALWDLKAKLHDLPLAILLGRARDAVPIYGRAVSPPIRMTSFATSCRAGRTATAADGSR